MPIQFEDAAELHVENIIVLLMGAPSTGKTTLGTTAQDVALLDFDNGVHRAMNRSGIATVRVRSWNNVASIRRDDLSDYKTVVIDTVGACQDFLTEYILASNPKMGSGGRLTLQGYGELGTRFKSWLSQLTSYGVDVVLIAHATEEQRGEETVERIAMVGQSRQYVYQKADLIGRLHVLEDGRRTLTFNPSESSYGKNVGLPDYEIESTTNNPNTLAEIIAEAKNKMNIQSSRQVEEQHRMTSFKQELSLLLPDPESFNEFLDKLRSGDASRAERKMLLDAALAYGMEYDRTQEMFVRNIAQNEQYAPEVANEMPADAEQFEDEEEDSDNESATEERML